MEHEARVFWGSVLMLSFTGVVVAAGVIDYWRRRRE